MKDIKSGMVMRELTNADLDRYDDLLRYACQVTGEELHKVGWNQDKSKMPSRRCSRQPRWEDGSKGIIYRWRYRFIPCRSYPGTCLSGEACDGRRYLSGILGDGADVGAT